MNFNTNIRYDFIANRKKFFMASSILVIIGLISLLLFQLNYGIDFKAGTSMDTVTERSVSQAEVVQILTKLGHEETPLIGGDNQNRISIRFNDVLDQTQINELQAEFKAVYGENTDFEVNVVSPDIARELGLKAIWGIIIASLLILLYVMVRFEWRFAIAANLTILYDCFVVVAIFSIFRLQVDLPFIAAVLTVLGYSINDKIVIFDRIRENLRFNSTQNADKLATIVNASIWQTMARNLYTVLTVAIVTILIFLFGSESIRLFTLAMLIGLISGAYSTLCLASPIWFELKKREKKKKNIPAAKPTP